jgi:hypothetical protein
MSGADCPLYTDSEVITLNVGGRLFVTKRSTLVGGSAFFQVLLSPTWSAGNAMKDGYLFVDANPRIFEHVLEFLRRSVPPVFWRQEQGFDYGLYAALEQEARYFGILKLAEWISAKQYEQCIRMRTSIDFCAVHNLLGTGSVRDGNVKETIGQTEIFSRKGGEKRRQINLRKMEFKAPVRQDTAR